MLTPEQKLADLLPMLLVCFAPPETEELGRPGLSKEIKEAEAEAKKVLETDKAPSLSRVEAYGVLGLWSNAFREFAKVMQDDKSAKRDYVRTLDKLIDKHPGVREPVTLRVPNVLLADEYYAKGLSNYFGNRLLDAEQAFRDAIKYNGDDARFYYFLGLTRWKANSRDLTEPRHYFQQGAQREKLARPSKVEINASLERVQGPMRVELNKYRP